MFDSDTIALAVRWSLLLVATVMCGSALAQPTEDKAGKAESAAGQSAPAESAGSIDALVQAARKKSAALSPAARKANQQLFANAFTLFQKGEFASARRGFEMCLGVDPADAIAHFYLAETLVRLKDTTAAREHYAMAKALGPTSVEGLRAATALEQFGGQDPKATQANAAALEKQRMQYADMGNGVISDGPSGLDWTKEDNGVGINWNDARAWCESKGSGWRLPTADELRRLYDDSPGRTTPCGQLTCKTPPGFHLTHWWFWSGEAPDSSLAWAVDLGAGRRLARNVGLSRRALCVRPS